MSSPPSSPSAPPSPSAASTGDVEGIIHAESEGQSLYALSGPGLADASTLRATWGAEAQAELAALPLACAGEFRRTLVRGAKYAARGFAVDFARIRPLPVVRSTESSAIAAEAPGASPPTLVLPIPPLGPTSLI